MIEKGIEKGVLPPMEVQIGTEVSQNNKDMLISNSIIVKGDHIEYFYSIGPTSILEGGSILTEDRVIFYLLNENKEIEVYEIYVNDISSIELLEKGNFMNDSFYKINSNKVDGWVPIPLSTENGGDVKFIEALRAKVKRISQ
jgi:signal peptidase I